MTGIPTVSDHISNLAAAGAADCAVEEPKTATNQINTLSQVLDDTLARMKNLEATLFGPEPTKPEDTAQPIIASIAEALKSVILQANDLDNRVQRIQGAL